MLDGFAEKVEEKGLCPTSEGNSVSIPERLSYSNRQTLK
jgi:hypothetical protein